MALLDADARRRLAWRAAPAALHALALGLVPLRAGDGVAWVAFGAVGWLAAAGLAGLWGERTRPRVAAGWFLAWLLVAGTTLGLVESLGEAALAFGLAFPVALFARHDKSGAPSLMLGTVVLGVLLVPGLMGDFSWARAETTDAWLASWAALLGLAAAALERERLARAADRPTAWSWQAVRAAFVTGFTFLVVGARGDIGFAALFRSFGFDPATQGGQIMLVAVFLASAVVAVLLFTGRREKRA